MKIGYLFFLGIPFEKKKFPNLKVGELKCMQSILYDSLENLSVSYFGLRWSIKIKSPWPPCIRGWPIVASTYNSTSIDYPKWNAPNGRQSSSKGCTVSDSEYCKVADASTMTTPSKNEHFSDHRDDMIENQLFLSDWQILQC